ncbi:MAG: mechanosensitive ion channel family protein, partial [Candidatus Marinimicrobia bacterium]|nr:mechanosensitive ion channel family protein [Candidatus Neomarinimicrobiota bacterium]
IMEWIKDNYNVLIANHLVRSALIIVGSIMVAKITDLVFIGIFKRLTARTRTGLDDKIVSLLHRPIFYSILFIGFSMAVKTAALPDYIDFALVGLFKTATILIWLFLISNVFIISMEWTSGRTENKILQKKTLPLFNNLGKIAIGLFGSYFIFLSWGININGILASASVLGVVLGLAAKDTVANFFAGIFLMADSPFKEGDYIILETGERGYVKSMGLRSTRFMTRDDIEIIIPNSVIAASKIVNESGGPAEIERIRITLLVAYGSDIDEVKALLKKIALDNDNIQNSPEPRVRFREFADSGIRLQLLFWIFKPEIRGRTIDAVNTEIYKQFISNNISIPYPTMKVILPENNK